MNREPNFDELIGAEATGAERERLRHVHELLLQAGPPPELTPELEAGPTLGMTLGRRRRRTATRSRPRALLLIAAAFVLALAFAAGYGVGRPGAKEQAAPVAHELSLRGTSAAPNAQATLDVWHSQQGNWPMTLRVVGLAKLPAHTYYEVYLVRNGRPWGSCGVFRVADSSHVTTVTLNAPYSLRKGDSWVVTRATPSGGEPGRTVLRPVTA